MNVYFRELRAHKKSLIIWSIVMIFFVYAGMQKYTTIMGAGGEVGMMQLINTMPKFIKSMWGISTLDVTTPIGYFGILFSYLALMASIHASMLGCNIIYKEERDKTVEFLMTKPISRSKIITSKIMAALTNVAVFNIVTYVTAILVLKGITDETILKQIILSMCAMFLIQTLFLILGIGLATIMKNSKKAGSITMAILISTFFLSVVTELSDSLKVLKFLTPFKYFDAKDFFLSGHLDTSFVLLTLVLITVILIFSYKKYQKRDLNI